jgi:hypothetical protein
VKLTTYDRLVFVREDKCAVFQIDYTFKLAAVLKETLPFLVLMMQSASSA